MPVADRGRRPRDFRPNSSPRKSHVRRWRYASFACVRGRRAAAIFIDNGARPGRWLAANRKKTGNSPSFAPSGKKASKTAEGFEGVARSLFARRDREFPGESQDLSKRGPQGVVKDPRLARRRGLPRPRLNRKRLRPVGFSETRRPGQERRIHGQRSRRFGVAPQPATGAIRTCTRLRRRADFAQATMHQFLAVDH
jgi:hypothetical protein